MTETIVRNLVKTALPVLAGALGAFLMSTYPVVYSAICTVV